ncbi:MAG: O-antigen ligase family protein [Bacillota bacterium]
MGKAQASQATVVAPKVVSVPFSHQVAFWGIAGLLFFTPFFRGLFFPPEQERALIVAALTFWLVYFGLWLRNKTQFFEQPLDWLTLGLPAAYCLSSFVAVNQGLAVNEIVKTALYFAVYWGISRLVTEEEVVRRILKVIWASGVLVALAGLGTATGIISIRDGFLGGRIYASFQYPNALANYLLCVLVLSAYLWVYTLGQKGGSLKEIWPTRPVWVDRLGLTSYLYTAGNFLIATVFWGAKSNGGILTLVIISLLVFLGVPREKRAPLFLHALQVGIPGLFVALQFINEAMAKHFNLAWLWVFLGLVLVIGLQVVYDLLFKGKVKRKIQIPVWTRGAGLVVLAAAVVGALTFRPDWLEKFKALIHFRNATERIYFYRDALEMILARPVLGWGGGGWQEAYRHFQHYLYNSTQVHGYYFQVGVETGIIGLLIIAGIWLAFLLRAHRIYHGAGKDNERRFLVWMLTVAALSVGIHSAIDFNLSLSALALVLFALFGIVAGLKRAYEEKPVADVKSEKKLRRAKKPVNPTPLVVVSAVTLIFVCGAFSLAMANNHALRADDALSEKSFDKALNEMRRARSYNPFNAEYDALISRIYLAQGDNEQALQAADAAVKKSKYSAVRFAELASAYQNARRFEDAVSAAEKAVANAPFQIQWYDNLSRVTFVSGYMQLNDKKPDKARPLFESAASVPGTIAAKMAKVTPEERRLWVVAPLMEPTPTIKINAGGALCFLGRLPESTKLLDEALKEVEKDGIGDQEKEMYAEACLWRALAADKQGDKSLAKQHLEKGKQAVPDVEAWYEQVKKLPSVK